MMVVVVLVGGGVIRMYGVYIFNMVMQKYQSGALKNFDVINIYICIKKIYVAYFNTILKKFGLNNC